MSSNRLSYDACAYKTELKQSTDPLEYMMYQGKYNNDFKCRVEFGLVGGNGVSVYSGNLVDLESDLRGQTRLASDCPEKMFKPLYDKELSKKLVNQPSCKLDYYDNMTNHSNRHIASSSGKALNEASNKELVESFQDNSENLESPAESSSDKNDDFFYKAIIMANEYIKNNKIIELSSTNLYSFVFGLGIIAGYKNPDKLSEAFNFINSILDKNPKNKNNGNMIKAYTAGIIISNQKKLSFRDVSLRAAAITKNVTINALSLAFTAAIYTNKNFKNIDIEQEGLNMSINIFKLNIDKNINKEDVIEMSLIYKIAILTAYKYRNDNVINDKNGIEIFKNIFAFRGIKYKGVEAISLLKNFTIGIIKAYKLKDVTINTIILPLITGINDWSKEKTQ